ncbi:MAG: hypothetical protein ABI144_06355 [Gallionella sp.]
MNKSTDETTSHLTKLANYANQVIGYARFDSCVARYSLLAYPCGMSPALRAVRLAIEAAAATRYWRSQPVAGTAASCPSRTGCFATPRHGNLATIYKDIV